MESKQLQGKSENTKKSYKRDLQLLHDYISKYEVQLDSLNHLIIQQYINQLKKEGYSPATINRSYASIRSFCHWTNQLEAVEYIEIQKVAHISKQESKGLTTDEVTNLRLRVANDKASHTKDRDLAIVDYLLYTGCRVSELCSLNKEDVSYHNGIYTVTIKETKNNEVRQVYIDSKQYKYIKRYLENRKDNSPALFISNRGRISVRMVQTMLNKYDIHPHMLRHTFCSILARKGVDPFTIAKLAGHKDINVTRRYSNPTAKEMAESVANAFTF